MSIAASNPFASRFLRPGAVLYFFPEDASATSLVQRLAQQDWRGQIVGPHGSGKSTLLVALLPEIERMGRQPTCITLHQGQRQMPALAATTLHVSGLLIVDGYEQLSWWSKAKLKRQCRRAGCGLLVTSHSDAGLPLLCHTTTSLALAERIVARLLENSGHSITSDELAAAYAANRGNIREMLFSLFDVYRQRQAGDIR